MFEEYNDILTVKELCEVLKIGRSTAYRLLQNGEIKSIRIGKVHKIPKKNILDYLDQVC